MFFDVLSDREREREREREKQRKRYIFFKVVGNDVNWIKMLLWTVGVILAIQC